MGRVVVSMAVLVGTRQAGTRQAARVGQHALLAVLLPSLSTTQTLGLLGAGGLDWADHLSANEDAAMLFWSESSVELRFRQAA